LLIIDRQSKCRADWFGHENQGEVRVFMTEHQNRQEPVNQSDQHSVHLARAFLFGAMDRQAPQQKCDDWFGVVQCDGMVPS
jgi:hypothetical protein